MVLIAGDEVVVTKSGKKTYGLGRFFSSLYGKAVPSRCFLSLSLISVKQHRSYPLIMEQVIKEKHKTENQDSAVKGSKKAKLKKRRDVQKAVATKIVNK